MHKTTFSLFFLCFLGFINPIIAQKNAKKQKYNAYFAFKNNNQKYEMSVFTGISITSWEFNSGNYLGTEFRYSLTKKVKFSSTFSLANIYNVYSYRTSNNSTYLFALQKMGFAFLPFKKIKWSFGAGFSHLYVPDMSFWRVGFPYENVSISEEREFYRISRKIQSQGFNFYGYSFSIQRRIRINYVDNLFVKFDYSKFFGDKKVLINRNKPDFGSLSVGWVF
jgi:hypothetical protein